MLRSLHGCEGAPERAREGAWAGRGRAEVVAGLQPVGEHVLGDGPPASPHPRPYSRTPLSFPWHGGLRGSVRARTHSCSSWGTGHAPSSALVGLAHPCLLFSSGRGPASASCTGPVPCSLQEPRALCLHMSLMFYILTLYTYFCPPLYVSGDAVHTHPHITRRQFY